MLNKKAINFNLKDQDGRSHQLSDYKGKYVLLYFYPKDLTPGCTIEAKKFSEKLPDLEALNVKVFGVSHDDVDLHRKFADKCSINFPLLADTEKELTTAFDVLKEKSMFGKTFMGISRESFLIDKDGIVIKHYAKVKPAEHPDEVIEDVKTLA